MQKRGVYRLDRRETYIAFRAALSSPKTVILLRWALTDWRAFLRLHSTDDEAATPALCAEWVAQARWGHGTTYNAVCHVRGYYKWMVRVEAISRNPWDGIAIPRSRHTRIPRVLARDEVEAMDRAVCVDKAEVARVCDVRALRDRALLAFLDATACRLSEAKGLDIGDLRLDEQEAIVRGKGSKERVVMFDERTADILREWLRKGRRKWTKAIGGPVFVGRRGGRMDPSVIEDAVKRAARAAGITRRVYPHLLRHSTATDLYSHGMGIRELQEFLGHAQVSTTQIYTHVSPNGVRSAYERARHPLPR